MKRIKLVYNRLVLCFLVGMSTTLEVSHAWAGPVPMPLEAQLDLMQDIVCGELVKLDPIPDARKSSVHFASATVAISETVKGESAGQITFRVIVKVDPEYQGATVLHTHRLGEAGIWSIAADGNVDNTYGLLSLKRREEVQAILKMLAERKWSEPVAGVQIWAKASSSDPRRAILAVYNCSEKVVYFPVATAHGFVQLYCMSEEGEVSIGVHRSSPENTRVFCRPLAPGEIRYVHPADAHILLSDSVLVPAGTTQVALSCQNYNSLGRSPGVGPTCLVRAWCGTLRTAPIDLKVSTR